MGINCYLVVSTSKKHQGLLDVIKQYHPTLNSDDEDEEIIADLGYCSDHILDELICELAEAKIEAEIQATAWSIPDEEDRIVTIREVDGIWCSQQLCLSERATLKTFQEVLDMLEAKTDPATIAQGIRQKMSELAEFNPIATS